MNQPKHAYAQLLREAKAVLDHNDQGSYTAPSNRIYPHQWLWDSCFIAIGLRHFDLDRSQRELRRLFAAQWSNGMLPHMILNPERRYWAERRLWNSQASARAPDGYATSGITQPPVPAIAALIVARSLRGTARLEFIDEVYPKLLAYHQWLYRERNPENKGLIVVIHPWETGMDNNPSLTFSLLRARLPAVSTLLLSLKFDTPLAWLRRDTKVAAPRQRTKNNPGIRALLLARGYRKLHYDSQRILEEPRFAVYSVVFNSILVQANQALVELAKLANQELPTDLRSEFLQTSSHLEQLWCEEDKRYYDYDLIAKAHIKIPTIAGFLPLACACVSTKRSDQLLKVLQNTQSFWPKYPVPTVPLDSSYFSPRRFWMGPTWVNTNWLLIQALRANENNIEAKQLRVATIELIKNSGFYEYYNPRTGKGLGTPGFSWTAALLIDLLNDE